MMQTLLISSILSDATTRPATRPFATTDIFGAFWAHTTWFEWITLLAGIFLGVVAGRVAAGALTWVSKQLHPRGWEMRAVAVLNAAGPANLALITLGLKVGLIPIFHSLHRVTALSDPDNYAIVDWIEAFFAKTIHLMLVLALGWFLFNLVDAIDFILRRLTAKTESQLDDQLVPLVRKTLRIFVVVIFALFIAQNVFNQDITAWLAGLGIAGLAVSLAAQDSIKNLFGSITIIMDRPFGVGDAVKVAGVEGTVEEIGFRSTKMRGGTGNLLTIPNSKVVDGSTENVSGRPNLQRVVDFRLAVDTPAGKMKEAVEMIRGALKEEEFARAFRNMEKFPPRAYFDEVGHQALRVRVTYWYYPVNDGWGFQDHGQRFNLRVLEGLERMGIKLVSA